MKKIFYFLAISCLGASCAFANLGETYQQSCARYGAPHHRHDGFVIWFINKDFSIAASFDDPGSRCDSIAYENWSGAFREDQLQTLIAFNIPSSEFYREYPVAETGRFWTSTKSHRTALLCIRIGDSGRNPTELSIWTQGHHERVKAAENNQTPVSQEIPAIDQLPTI